MINKRDNNCFSKAAVLISCLISTKMSILDQNGIPSLNFPWLLNLNMGAE